MTSPPVCPPGRMTNSIRPGGIGEPARKWRSPDPSAGSPLAESRPFAAEGILSAEVRLSRTKADDLGRFQTRIE